MTGECFLAEYDLDLANNEQRQVTIVLNARLETKGSNDDRANAFDMLGHVCPELRGTIP